MMIKELRKKGSLTLAKIRDLNYFHDTRDIAHVVFNKNGLPFLQDSVVVSWAFIGIQFRSPFNYVKSLKVNHCFSDSVRVQASDTHIGELCVRDIHGYQYSAKNHKDIVQFFHWDNKKHCLKNNEPLTDVSIDKMRVTVACDDKHILQFSEICKYKRVRLFKDGCDVVDIGLPNLRYLISATNADDWVIGSPEHPLDPERIGNRIIKIVGNKPGSPESKDIVIHAYPGLRLELDQSARKALTLIEYKR